MSEVIAPGDNVTLALNLFRDGTGAETTRKVRCHVYDPSNTEIDDSPFAVTHIAKGQYANNDAYSASSIGYYKHLYITYDSYTDETTNSESDIYRRASEKVKVKTEAVFGQSLVDANVIGFSEGVLEKIARMIWRFKLDKIKTPGSAGKILVSKSDSIPPIDLSRLDTILKKLETIESKDVNLAPLVDELQAIRGVIAESDVSNDISKIALEIAKLGSKQDVIKAIEQASKKIDSSISKNKVKPVSLTKIDKQLVSIISSLNKGITESDIVKAMRSLSIKEDIVKAFKSKKDLTIADIKNAIALLSTKEDIKMASEKVKASLDDDSKVSKELLVDMINQLNQEEATRLKFVLEALPQVIRKELKKKENKGKSTQEVLQEILGRKNEEVTTP